MCLKTKNRRVPLRSGGLQASVNSGAKRMSDFYVG